MAAVETFFWKPPSAAEIKEWGLEPSDFKAPTPPELFPENDLPFNLFRAHQNQWRVGYGGPYGLDMNIFLHELDRRKLDDDDYDDALWAIGVIERDALVHLCKKD